MGGEIDVHSEPGLGSRFWFTARFTPAAEKPSTPISLSGTWFLAVDDNATNRSILQQQLACWRSKRRRPRTAPGPSSSCEKPPPLANPMSSPSWTCRCPAWMASSWPWAIREDATLTGTPLVLLTSLDLDVPE